MAKIGTLFLILGYLATATASGNYLIRSHKVSGLVAAVVRAL